VSAFTDATHNLLFQLNGDQWLRDMGKSGKAHLTGYQEAEGDPARATLAEFSKAHNRGLYHPPDCGNPISWDLDTFRQIKVNGQPVEGVHESHAGATRMGIKAKFNPPRDFAWVGLVHRATGKRVLRINVHPLAGATKRESNPDNPDSDELSAWKDWGIGQYWLDVLAFTAEQMSVQDPGVETTAAFWDVILLGGDFNAAMDNGRRWYYPACMLPALYGEDELRGGLDHLLATHGSDVKPGRRWSVAGFTDHRIHFLEYDLRDVADFPRDV